MNLRGVEQELNRMRAESLGDAGRKIEILGEFMAREASKLMRLEKIDRRIVRLLLTRLPKLKRKQLEAIKKRMPEKKDKTTRVLEKMETKRKELIANFKIQRESMGLTDHSWLERICGKQEGE